MALEGKKSKPVSISLTLEYHSAARFMAGRRFRFYSENLSPYIRLLIARDVTETVRRDSKMQKYFRAQYPDMDVEEVPPDDLVRLFVAACTSSSKADAVAPDVLSDARRAARGSGSGESARESGAPSAPKSKPSSSARKKA